ncbi:MAG: caspase family protein [Rhodobacteraceae bacterium]|nr:caspase family protein [Paracoccaceae bacterium]
MRGVRLLIILLVAAIGWPAAAADRIALVIGMSAYENVPKLRNTVSDARLVAGTLEGIGFDVTTIIDRGRDEVIAALGDFAFRAEAADLALIYFAGHGVEVQGENFLLPVDVNVRSNRDVQAQSISLKDFLAAVDHARKMRIVILDSCRDNPFPDFIDLSDPEAAGGTAVIGRGMGGLAAPSPDRGTLVAFAARAGQVALDGKGENSPFARALHDKLAQPGVEIGIMFRQVRDAVLAETGNLQEPNTYGALPGVPFYLAGSPEEREALAVDDPSAAWSSIRPEQAVQLAALAEKGDPRSMLGLAYMQLDPDSDRYDPAAAARLLTRSAAQGDPEAQFQLARLYEKGIGVPGDLDRARTLYEAAAAQDYADAINELGFFYFNGAIGLPIDQARALELFRRAADLRQPEAMFNMASFIDDGFVPGAGPGDAAGYLYGALRAGSANVLRELSENPKSFKKATRAALQERLRDNGFYSGPLDGSFGPGTIRAIRAAYGILEAG